MTNGISLIRETRGGVVISGPIMVALTRKEFDLIELLAHRPGVVTREQIFDYLYGGEDRPDPKILDVFISKIRRKLRRSGLDLIQTIWGRGYKLAA